MGVSLKNYNKPRPVWMKVLGDTCVYAGSAVTGVAIGNEAHVVAYISLGLLVFGFFFSNLFSALDKERTFEIKDEDSQVVTTKIVKEIPNKEDDNSK